MAGSLDLLYQIGRNLSLKKCGWFFITQVAIFVAQSVGLDFMQPFRSWYALLCNETPIFFLFFHDVLFLNLMNAPFWPKIVSLNYRERESGLDALYS